MKYLKLFESFFSEPIFYRFSHVDILNGKDLDLPSEQIGNFYSSDLGKKIKRFQDSAPFELKRQEALNLLKKWRDSL